MSTYMQIGCHRLVDYVKGPTHRPQVNEVSFTPASIGTTILNSYRTPVLFMAGQRGRTVGYPPSGSEQGPFYDDGPSNVLYGRSPGGDGTSSSDKTSGVSANRAWTAATGVWGSDIYFEFGVVAFFR